MKLNIIGCGYIGKKIAVKPEIINTELSCFVYSEQSLNACKESALNAERIDLDTEDAGYSLKQKKQLELSHIAYLVAPQPGGKHDLRMQHFVSLLKSLDSPPETILLISTTGVYGDCNGEWIDETKTPDPQADRAFRRLDAENQLQAYCDLSNVALTIFRVPGIYASDKLPLKRISSGEPIVSAADSGFTNRIHADDLAALCAEAMISNRKPGIYNCCDGNPSTMNDYFMRVADAKGLTRPREISLQQAQKELSAGMLSYLAESKRISNKKLLKNFKTKFKYPDLKSGLKSIR